MNGKKDYRKDYARIIDEDFPSEMTISFGDKTLRYKKKTWKIPDDNGTMVERGLRYGENPGQQAALYELAQGELTLGATQYRKAGESLVGAIAEENLIQIGKHPSMNNLTDVDSALLILRYLMDEPAVVIVKHNNPSGVAQRATLRDAYVEANLADTVAAFGGAAVFNRAVDEATAREIAGHYLEVVCAPDFEAAALDLLKKKKNLRIIRLPKIARLEQYATRRYLEFKALMGGGLIVQQSPLLGVNSEKDLQPAVSEYKGKEYRIAVQPTPAQVQDMLFGWKVEQGVKSNSVIFVKNKTTVAIGTGGQDRVGVAEMAIAKARTKYADRLAMQKHAVPYWVLKSRVEKGELPSSEQEGIDAQVEQEKGGIAGSVMVSDGFFPFRDTVDLAASCAVAAIIQPGGSMRDFESIEACNEHSIAMVFTGIRAFRH